LGWSFALASVPTGGAEKGLPEDMRVVSRSRWREFCKAHPDAQNSLDAWYHIVKGAEWKAPKDVKEQFGTASFLADNITVFNIAGNKYRLVTRVRFDLYSVFVMEIFTHKEYDDWNDSRR
jgi:mRNA interferase HigB